MNPADLKRGGHVCVTANQEWLIHDAMCVAVRDRSSDEWLEDHFAVDERVDLVARAVPSEALHWDLQVCTFGLTLQMGPVLAIHRASDALLLAAARDGHRPPDHRDHCRRNQFDDRVGCATALMA